MTVREILSIGHPLLRTPALDVALDEIACERVQSIVDDLVDTMRDANGAGLAANQIGETCRIVVLEVIKQSPLPLQTTDPVDDCHQPATRSGRRRDGGHQRRVPIGTATR